MINMPLICLLVTPSKRKEKKVLPKFGQNLGKNGAFNKKNLSKFRPERPFNLLLSHLFLVDGP